MTPPAPPGLAATSVRGSGWLLLSTMITSALQLVSAAVLGRLLTPADFGVVAAAGLLIRVVYYFSQFGLGSALVQRPELSDDDVRAAAWLAVVIGAVATLGGVLAAPLLAALLHQPGSVRIAQFLSLSFLLTGIATTPLALLRRRLRFRAVAVLDVASYAIGYLLFGLAAVLAGAGVWSLVVAALGQAAVQALGCLLLAPHPISLRPSRRALGPMARFGGQVSFVGLLEFWSLQLDSLGVARGRPAADLGQYTRGTLLAYPVVQASLVTTRVLASAFARVGDAGRLRQAYGDALALTATGSLTAAAVLAAGHDVLVRGLLGSQWAAAGAILPWLAGASALQALSQLPAVLCEARGVLRPKIWIQVAVLTVFAASVATAVHAGAQLWVYAACWLGSELVRQILYTALLTRRFAVRTSTVARVLGQAAVPALAAFVVVGVVDRLLQDGNAPTWCRLVAVLAGGSAVPLTVIACWPGARLRRVVRDRDLLHTVPAGVPGRQLLVRVFA